MRTLRRQHREPQGSQVPCAVVGASVDWITCTARRENLGGELWDTGVRILTRCESEGESPARWQMKGYRGWATDGCRLGARQDGVLLALSGFESVHHWREAEATAEHCSRLDLAVDVHCDPVVPSLSRDAYRKAAHKRTGKGRPVKRSLVLSGDGGSTLYLGARVSDRFARLYDKGIEQRTAPRGKWWRWELELKGDSATPTARTLAGTPDESSLVQSIVRAHFLKLAHVALPAPSPAPICNGVAKTISADRRLLWLSRGVRPTVQALIEEKGALAVLRALSLPTSAVEMAALLTNSGRHDASRSGGALADDVADVA